MLTESGKGQLGWVTSTGPGQTSGSAGVTRGLWWHTCLSVLSLFHTWFRPMSTEKLATFWEGLLGQYLAGEPSALLFSSWLLWPHMDSLRIPASLSFNYISSSHPRMNLKRAACLGGSIVPTGLYQGMESTHVSSQSCPIPGTQFPLCFCSPTPFPPILNH